MSDWEEEYSFPPFSDEDDHISSFNLSSDSILHNVSTASATLYVPSPSKNNKTRATSTPRKQPRKPATVPLSSHICTVCGKKYKSEKTLKKHKEYHVLEDVASKNSFADITQFRSFMLKAACHIAENLPNCATAQSDCGSSFLEFASKVKNAASPEPSNEFVDFFNTFFEVLEKNIPTLTLQKGRKLLPSSTRGMVRVWLVDALSDQNTQKEWIDKLLKVVSEETAKNNNPTLYLQEFTQKMKTSCTAYILQQMRSPNDAHVEETKKWSQDDFDKLFSQQTLHYVAGFCVKSMLRKSRQYPNSKRWQQYKTVILSRICTIGTSVATPEDASFWTALLSRKSLVFVNSTALNFFIEVAKVICYSETSNGSIPRDDILKTVSGSFSILAVWDEVIGGNLAESESLGLMRLLVASLCGPFGKGILLRRMNALTDAKIQSVGIRGRLTR